MTRKQVTLDGNTAVAYVAHATNEVCAIYPITPSSVMGEVADIKSAAGEKNIWGVVPTVSEMQSEGGAAGAVHGALQAGTLTTTFTASQGLLLMIPNMYKIAGELLPTVFHVSARSLAMQALSIFGDHSDVMACRQTGFAMLAAGSVQEAMDFALVSQAATLESRVPFLHFFDGFRTSHEVNKVEQLSFDDMRAMIDEAKVREFKQRALSPDHPVLRGTAQNPDVYFQGRETVNKFHDATPGIVQQAMAKFATLTGRQYRLFDYFGAPDATRVIIAMGSGAEVVRATVDHLVKQGEKVGVVVVRLFRPFDISGFVAALPKTVQSIACLDRTKEPGSIGEPLYEDVRTAIGEAMMDGKFTFSGAAGYPVIIGGRYGLGSKEFTPAMVKAVFDNLAAKAPKNHFTVGIEDDVTHTSLTVDAAFDIETKDTFRAVFYGLGSDGTVGANKNSIKIIGEETPNFAQGYFVYDSKKAGSMTVSHLRFGKDYIRAPYLVSKAHFIGCHQTVFIEKYSILDKALPGAVFLLNTPLTGDAAWASLNRDVQETIISKKLKFYVIDAYQIAKEQGMGAHINVIMQTVFFGISGVLPKDDAIAAIKAAIKKSYGKKGDEVVKKNWAAVDAALAAAQEVKYPASATSTKQRQPFVSASAPQYVRETEAKMIGYAGDTVKVSEMPVDGTFPTATSQWEKRNIAIETPVWDKDLCIQCGICSLVCPHAAIRLKVYDPAKLAGAPATFKSADAKGGKELAGLKCTVQVAVEDCTGCGACVYNCPAKDKANPAKKAINLAPQFPLRETERANFAFFLDLPELDESKLNRGMVKGTQLVRPLFEFSGACAGCGETPYIKLLTQMFGDRMLIANATGCTSIYGGNLPTTPYAQRADGRGPAWSNSLFEDNAEFGFGMRLALDKMQEEAKLLVAQLAGTIGDVLAKGLLESPQQAQAEIEEQRKRVADLKAKLQGSKDASAQRLLLLADYLVEKSLWIIGGDGWAYDIGYGGLDHVLAMGRKVRILVLDTEVYSNTGGQMSKSTPRGAVAQFAAAGKPAPKKDLSMMAMAYGTIYVARVAMGANNQQTVKAFQEAEAYNGASIVIAYSHCIAHGIDMSAGMNEQKKAVTSGYWPLFRFNPDHIAQGKNPLMMDSTKITSEYEEYAYGENRYRTLQKSQPERAAMLMAQAKKDVAWRFNLYQQIAAMQCAEQNKQ